MNIGRNFRWVGLSSTVAALMLLAGCISTDYRVFEKDNNQFRGRGATRSSVDGMDIWDDAPPRPFMIMGMLYDKRMQGPIYMAMLDGSMVKEARKRGGDALVRMGESSEFSGAITNSFSQARASNGRATGFGVGATTAVNQYSSQYAVIKYLSDETGRGGSTMRSEPGADVTPATAGATATPPAASTNSQPAKTQLPGCFLNAAGKCL